MSNSQEFKNALERASAEVMDSIRESSAFAMAGNTRGADAVAARKRQLDALRAWHKLINSTNIPDRGIFRF